MQTRTHVQVKALHECMHTVTYMHISRSVTDDLQKSILIILDHLHPDILNRGKNVISHNILCF